MCLCIVVPKRFDWLPCAPPDLGKPLSSNPPITTQRLLVLWGMDKQNADLLGDAWVLNVTSLTWKKVRVREIGELKHHIESISSIHYLLGSRLERGTVLG